MIRYWVRSDGIKMLRKVPHAFGDSEVADHDKQCSNLLMNEKGMHYLSSPTYNFADEAVLAIVTHNALHR